ncbi:hypothetical protein AB3K78_05045 [Leucobacter sp. HNU]|uniref:hypothetical protein n=1 Tax=Leucobacter sp. HNU TaxID=3236805 RepID=UPI003A80066B
MRRFSQALRTVIERGPLLSRWSACGTLPIALSVMGPFLGPRAPQQFPELLLAALASWVVIAGLLCIPAGIARAILSPGARTVLVGAPVLLLSAARPLLTDLCAALLGADPPPAQWLPFRIATNVVVWPILLLVIAVIVASFRGLRIANRRLAEATESGRTDADRLRAREDAARSATAACAVELRTRLRGLDASPDAVRVFGTGPVRDWSRRLAELADADLADAVPLSRPSDPAAAAARETATPRLRLPPMGTVPCAYALAVLPYAVHTVAPLTLAAGALTILLSGVVVDLSARRLRHGTALFAVLWGIVGLSLAAAQLVDPALPAHYAWVPAIAIPLIALAAERTSALVHGLRSEERRLEAALLARRRRLAEGDADTTRALRAAAGVLHRDVQGACVHFAAANANAGADDRGASAWRAACGAALDRVDRIFETEPEPAPGCERLAATLRSWSLVLALDVRIDAGARQELERSDALAERALEVVTEGLVNAVKHTHGRAASVRATRIPTGGGPIVQVDVVAPGVLPPAAALRPNAPAAALGAELLQSGTDTVLRARLRAPAVVPPEHRAEASNAAG